MFRPLRFLPHVVLVLLLAAGVCLALATRYPESEILARAASWSVVGPAVERFRAAYLPAARAPADGPLATEETPAEPSREVELIRVIDPDMIGPKPKVWARAGTPIYAEPDVGAREIGRVEHLFPLSRLDRRGDWFRVRYGTRLSGFNKGWVHLPDYREPTQKELNAPAPVLPLAPVVIAAEAEAVARRWMGEPVAEGRCGPFRLVTDVAAPEPLAMCERVASRVEAAHRRRYGLELLGEAAETILLFSGEAGFRAFRDEVSPALTGDAFASPARGFVAVPVEDRLPVAVESSLIHELAHLLNRRSLGPALPPWLDEGIARDLDTVGVGAGPGESPLRRPVRGRVQPLEHLFDLDRVVFQTRADENYRAAGRWMGYLVDGPDSALAEEMRRFLRAVAAGEPIRVELLLDHLGGDWSELEAGFRAWERDESRAALD